MIRDLLLRRWANFKTAGWRTHLTLAVMAVDWYTIYLFRQVIAGAVIVALGIALLAANLSTWDRALFRPVPRSRRLAWAAVGWGGLIAAASSSGTRGGWVALMWLVGACLGLRLHRRLLHRFPRLYGQRKAVSVA